MMETQKEILDQYIKKHKQAFEEEPAAGHFERFQQKMNTKKRKTVSFQRWSMAVAASLLLLLSAGVLLQYLNRPADIEVVCEGADDMKQCYMSQMNDAMYHIEMLTKKLDMEEWEQEAIMNDVQMVMQSSEYFEQELPEELSDKASKQILSDYYRHNLESLRTIAQSLEEKK